jgi:hypothetical protein
MIMGLPGETVKSFKKGCYDIIRAGNHHGLKFNLGILIVNTEMNLLQRKLFKMKTVLINDAITPYTDEILEPVEMIRSTSTMTEEEILDLVTWSTFLQTFHIGGFTTMISRYLHKSQQLEYEDFYDKLWDFLNQDKEMHAMFQAINQAHRNRYKTGFFNYYLNLGPDDEFLVHSFVSIMALQMTIHAKNQLQHVFDLLHRFLIDELKVSEQIADQLIVYVRHHVTDLYGLHELPKIVTLDYDFLGYVINNTELNNPVTYLVDFHDNKFMGKREFIEKIAYRKKLNFGTNSVVPMTPSKAPPQEIESQ